MTSHTKRRRVVHAFRRLLGKAERVGRQIRRGREEMRADIRRRLHNFFYNPLPPSRNEVVEEEEIPPPLPPRNPDIPPPLPPRNPVILDDDDDIDEIPPPLPPRKPRVRPLPPIPVRDRPILPPLPTPGKNVYLNDLLLPTLSQRRAAIEASDDEDGEYSGFGRVKLNKRKRRKRNPLAGTAAMKAHMAWVRSFKRS